MRSYTLQVDDKHLPVQDRRLVKNIKRSHRRVLVGDHYYVAYRYSDSWCADTVLELLGECAGWMQVAGYKRTNASLPGQGHRGRLLDAGCMPGALSSVRPRIATSAPASPLELIGQL